MSGKERIHLSSSDLKSGKLFIDLILAGTMLNKAGPTEEKELKMSVLMLRTLDFPSSRTHVAPRRSE